MSDTPDPQPLLSTKETLAEQMALGLVDKGKSPSVAVTRSLLATLQRFRVALEQAQAATQQQYSVMSRVKTTPPSSYRPNDPDSYGTLEQAQADMDSLQQYSPHQNHTIIVRTSPSEWKPL